MVSCERNIVNIQLIFLVALSDRNTQAVDNWHIFNDFLVQQVPRDEALRFDPAWKLPSVLTYQIRTAAHRIDDSWKEKLDTQLLYTRLYHRQALRTDQLTKH